jgi:hypothetical protein
MAGFKTVNASVMINDTPIENRNKVGNSCLKKAKGNSRPVICGTV